MNKRDWLRSVIAAILACGMSACSAVLLLYAVQIPSNALSAYLCSAVFGAICVLFSRKGVCSLIALGLGGGILCFSGRSVNAVVSAIRLNDMEQLMLSSDTMSAMIACILCICFFLLLSHRSGTVSALAVMGMICMVAYTLNDEIPLSRAIPGLFCAVIAFAVNGRNLRFKDFLRILLPSVMAVALALLLVPNEGITFKPLKDAADYVTQIFEEYFRFTQERIPFTINTEGYDHAAEVNGTVEARLGGPANPNTDAVMRVTSDADLLLRGSIRRTYTGGSWTDSSSKSRYLFLDFTHSGVRSELFGMADIAGFDAQEAQVEFLADATSTLFVPGRLQSFSMDVQNAVYYNSIGEMFLTRTVEAGDSYSFVALIPNDASIRAIMTEDINESETDGCLQLPDGIESDVYTLTQEITADCTSNYDRALAIERWLKSNCTYTLEPGYPLLNRDFVSQFVLDTREGYCSYFASAMTVMCRIAGVPARYVEGYYVRMDGAESVILTGENAHAWTEVYIGGIGWVAFNPAGGSSFGAEGSDETEEPQTTPQPDVGNMEASASPSPDPTLPPDSGDNSQSTPEPTEEPTVPPDSVQSPEPQASATPEPSFAPFTDDNDDSENHRSGAWLWILLILLLIALIALLVRFVRARLRRADPMLLIANATAQTAMLILYRACLTLLSIRGIAPQNDETPAAFARRLHEKMPNADFIAFAQALEKTVYAHGKADGACVSSGKRAYQTFLRNLTVRENLKFKLHRIFKGLGNFTSIP